MQKTIDTEELRASMPKIVESVKRGEQFTVMYGSRPAFRIVPLEEDRIFLPLSQDPLYNAGAVGESFDGLTGVDHDSVLYGKCR